MKRYGNKRDANERPIIDALKKIGCSVYQMDKPLDLLVGFRARCFLLEVKSPGGTLTQDQKDFMRGWKGQVRVVETPEEAIEVVTESYQ
jgi:hypothetical protein